MPASITPGMRRHTPDEARRVVRQLRRWQRIARQRDDRSFVFPSDEFYLAAGAQIPAARRYDGFPQWENGIGMTRTLLDDWRAVRRRIRDGRLTLPAPKPDAPTSATLACGTLIAPTLRRIADEAAALTGLQIDVVPVVNTLFGERVNVSGLIPGADFGDALEGRPLGDRVFLPRASLDYFGARFLDDTTLDQLESRLHRPIAFVYTFSDLLESMAAPDAATSPARPAQTNGRAWTSPALPAETAELTQPISVGGGLD